MAEHRRVRVVTDSCADIPETIREALGISMVPLNVSFGAVSFRSHVDITAEQFLDRLRRDRHFPATAAPAPQLFEDTFRHIIEADMDALYVGISSKLSGTLNAGRLAAEALPAGRVRIVNSLGMSMQQGWSVIEAARAAASGVDLAGCVSRAHDAMTRSACFAVLATLEYAHKGGRIGRAHHMIGSALGIKPVINFIDGVLTPIERVRTWKRALRRAIDLAIASVPAEVAILHSGNLDDARMAAAQVQDACPDAAVLIDWCGPTISAYAGPGSIGIFPLRHAAAGVAAE